MTLEDNSRLLRQILRVAAVLAAIAVIAFGVLSLVGCGAPSSDRDTEQDSVASFDRPARRMLAVAPSARTNLLARVEMAADSYAVAALPRDSFLATVNRSGTAYADAVVPTPPPPPPDTTPVPPDTQPTPPPPPPVSAIAFSSSIGGNAHEQSRDAATDASGNVYITGGTQSANFPTTANAFQRVHNPGTPESAGVDRFDVFVTKLAPNGSIIWSTLLGGPNYDRAYAIEIGPDGSVYVAGRAGHGFPVTQGAFQTSFSGKAPPGAFYGEQAGFICKIQPDGSAVVWCSYFGGNADCIVRDIALDPAGDIYVASGWNPVYGDALPPVIENVLTNAPLGGKDALIAKIASDGARVLWARYIGGSAMEPKENSVRVDAQGRATFLTAGLSKDAFISPNAADKAPGPAGTTDFYIAKVAADGKSLLWATYFGGSKNEWIETHNLAIDAAGNAYVTGTTTSTDLPVTGGRSAAVGAFQRTYAGGSTGATNYPGDAFVAKISADGTRILAATYLGGRGGDGGEGIAVAPSGNVYLSGSAQTGFPTTDGSTGKGLRDVFVAGLSPDLDRLLYSSLTGGAGEDLGRGLALGIGAVYVVGEAATATFPRVRSVAQSAFGGGKGDALLIRAVPTAVAPIPIPPPVPTPVPVPIPTPVPVPVPSPVIGRVAPNLPAGFTLYTSRDFSTKARTGTDNVGAQGWDAYEWGRTHVTIVNDPSAPASPPGIMRHTFPIGQPNGSSPGKIYYAIPNRGARSLYASAWIRLSPNWQQSAKIFYIRWTGGSYFFHTNLACASCRIGSVLRINHAGFTGIANANIPYTAELVRGKWHLLELLVQLSSTPNAPDGVVKVWQDGVLVVNKTNWPLPGGPPFVAIEHTPVYAGIPTLDVQMYMDRDHVVVAGK